MQKLLFTTLALVTLYGLWKLNQSKTDYSYSKNIDEFMQFQRKYEKIYLNDEQSYRFRIFSENKKLIDQHNENKDKTGSLYTLGINQFADLTWEEFQSKYLMNFPKESFDHKCTQDKDYFVNQNLIEGDAYDWDNEGYVQKVKNQAMCGSCWAFSAVGAIESALAIKNQLKNQVPNLSEQELVDCSSEYGNFGCQGGLINTSFDYVLDHHLNEEDKYPYIGTSGECKTKDIGEGKVSLNGCVQLDMGSQSLIRSLRKQPVSVGFHVGITFQFYMSGIYNPWICIGRPNHGVLVVGFDLSNSTPFYRVKNSWGENWGEQGFFRIAIGKKKSGTCNITGHKLNYFPLVQ